MLANTSPRQLDHGKAMKTAIARSRPVKIRGSERKMVSSNAISRAAMGTPRIKIKSAVVESAQNPKPELIASADTQTAHSPVTTAAITAPGLASRVGLIENQTCFNLKKSFKTR
jgi:hypothetical protein